MASVHLPDLSGDRLHWRRDTFALATALAAFILHAAFAGRYDLFRDELYFIVCGRHPAFGYVDQPPLVPLMAAWLYGLGKGLFLVRLPLALAAGALAWLAVRFVRLLEGGPLAAFGAGLAVTIAPMLMGLGAILNTTAFDPLAWTAIAYCLVLTLETGDRHPLWLCGAIAGIDLEMKYALVFWGVSLAIGLMLTPERRLLARRDFWLAVLLAGVLAAPSIIWQALNGFPFLELAAAARGKNVDTSPLAFALNQLLVMSPFLAPVWIAGVVGPFLIEKLRPTRFLAYGFIACWGLVIATHGKDYYLAAAYPVMFVTGAVTIEHLVRGRGGRMALAGWAGVTAAVSALMAPMTLPVLSPPALQAYMTRFPIKPQQQEKSFHGTLLPQVFADQLGWRDFTTQVAAAWNRIPAGERARTAIKVDNYGEAGALDIYGQGLPPALSGHNQYYLWGLRGQKPENALVVQRRPEDLAPYCLTTTVLATTSSPFAMASENGKAIVYCRGLKADLKVLWPKLKNFS